MTDINIDLFRVFTQVARAGNISKAAESLFVSQSAVSQAIRQLEMQLDAKLFDRGARGVALTPEGQTLYAFTDSAMTLIGNAREKLHNMRNLRAGAIKIGASDTICSLFLLPVLERFNDAHPDIHISVTNKTTLESIELLKSGAVDIAVANLPINDDPALEVIPVMPIHDIFVAGRKYAHLVQSVLQLSDLADYPVLMLETASNSRRQIDAFLASRGLNIRPSIELGSLSMLAEFARIGLGIAATIKEDVQRMLDSGELYELRFNEPLPPRQIGLILPRNVTLSFAARSFVDDILTSTVGCTPVA